jgi:hypothetical protein
MVASEPDALAEALNVLLERMNPLIDLYLTLPVYVRAHVTTGTQ